MKNYLGIDPSTKATGYCIMNEDKIILESGTLYPGDDVTFEEMLHFKYTAIQSLITKYNVVGIGCENQFKGPNVLTLIQLSRVTGIVQLLAAQHDIPIELYQPASWRKVFHGKGNAKKEDTLDLVNETYQLGLKKKHNDQADAIGIAATRVVSDQK